MDSLGMKVSKLLLQEEPKLLVCDPTATAKVTGDLAAVMGCLLATVLTKGGERAYLQAIKVLMTKVHDNACKTAGKAVEISALRDMNTSH